MADGADGVEAVAAGEDVAESVDDCRDGVLLDKEEQKNRKMLPHFTHFPNPVPVPCS